MTFIPQRQNRKTATNRRLAKKRVKYLNEALCFVSSSVLAESFLLRNPLLRQAPKRYMIPLSYTNRTKNPAKKKIYNSKELHLQL